MHKYIPRIWIIRCDDATRISDLYSQPASSFMFRETEFIAVTAYQVSKNNSKIKKEFMYKLIYLIRKYTISHTYNFRTKTLPSWKSTTINSRRDSGTMVNLGARENFRRKWRDWVASTTRMRPCFRNLNRRTERIIWMWPIKDQEQPPAKQEVWTTVGLVVVEESVHPFSYPETEIHRRRRMSIERRNRDCTGHGSILLHNFRRPRFRPPRRSTCRPDSTILIFPCIILACFIPPWWWIQTREVTVPMDETIYEISSIK